MILRRLLLACWTLGVCALWTTATQADEPNRFVPPPATGVAVSDHQAFANAIAQHLRNSGALKQYNINVTVLNGVVTLEGQVADSTQRDTALGLVRTVPGVQRVIDQLSVRSNVTPVAVSQPPLAEPPPLLRPPTPQAQPIPAPGLQPLPGLSVPGMQAVPNLQGLNVPGLQAVPNLQSTPGPQGYMPEPTPIFQAPPGGSPLSMAAPPMPPYAWPSYAPYNNYSRVAYPTLYPPNAWPFIGPMYPFPKVPPGWRGISLNYYDGCWWYGKHGTCHDWWRIRYH